MTCKWHKHNRQMMASHMATLVSNVQQRPLTSLEFARELRDILGDGYTEESLSKALSKPRKWVRMWINISRLPDRLVERISGP